ncbi:hypothetical protein CCP3SC1AL1_1470005 [Gammaproteobacteria bacterium]
MEKPWIVANNMVMESETAHVLQTCHMLSAFCRVLPEVRYLWPDFGKRVGCLSDMPLIRVPIPCCFRYGALRYSEFVFRIRRYLPDQAVLFTRSFGVALTAQSLVSRVVLELHQALSPRARSFSSRLEPNVYIVAISEGLRQDLISIDHLPKERITVQHDGVDVEHFRSAEPLPLTRLPLPERRTQCTHLYYGTLRPERGLSLIRHAAERLPEHGFVLVGGGIPEVRAALESGLALPNVRVVPAMEHYEIPRLLRSFDSILMPHTRAMSTYRWTSPLKLFEIMASGTPAIMSRVPTIEEVVDERDVRFIDNEAPESLVEALLDLEKNPEAARDRARVAQEKAVAQHSWEQRAREIVAFSESY